MTFPSDSLVSIQGWLRQKMPAYRFDRKLYCVVTENYFLQYQDETLTNLDSSFALSSIKSISSVSSSSQSGFSIVLDNKSTFTFLSPNLPEVQKWICALQTEPPSENISIDSFSILYLIGKGSSGKVFLAKMGSSGDLYAIKVIRKDRIPSEARESRVRAERNALMRAKHPFITRLFYAFQNQSKLYFVLEYVSGGDLRHHIDRSVRFSRNQSKLYLAEIVVALRTIHSLGIVYRDLKPENILIDEKGHIKLADFGLAREIDSNNGAYSLCGTCEYIAPEMLKHESQTFSVDWWSFGVIAYYLLVGKLPFQSMNRSRLFEMIISGTPRFPPTVDKTDIAFISALLEKDPSKRLGSFGTDITKHPFFSEFDFRKVEEKQYTPEFVPFVDNLQSVENFDSTFTTQTVADSFVESSSLQINVIGFSYVGEDIAKNQPEEELTE